jgi:hypothetical protein
MSARLLSDGGLAKEVPTLIARQNPGSPGSRNARPARTAGTDAGARWLALYGPGRLLPPAGSGRPGGRQPRRGRRYCGPPRMEAPPRPLWSRLEPSRRRPQRPGVGFNDTAASGGPPAQAFLDAWEARARDDDDIDATMNDRVATLRATVFRRDRQSRPQGTQSRRRFSPCCAVVKVPVDCRTPTRRVRR